MACRSRTLPNKLRCYSTFDTAFSPALSPAKQHPEAASGKRRPLPRYPVSGCRAHCLPPFTVGSAVAGDRPYAPKLLRMPMVMHFHLSSTRACNAGKGSYAGAKRAVIGSLWEREALHPAGGFALIRQSLSRLEVLFRRLRRPLALKFLPYRPRTLTRWHPLSGCPSYQRPCRCGHP